ncbi:Apolipoprotein N-acyltransferase [Sulfitobacter brevis]|uniref:Apolipoprotein N-acyltransferase n=1 Tax=Sulfitobacter brevis TaxID=74348 RepID=A0A1I1X414_9RHOB|nr:apolipoprotein N-acyltransferase [Sulfitobacter brevis]SFE02165.1 Apolipoprotein N-acyltransferase [Sulfitobacter brevis]
MITKRSGWVQLALAAGLGAIGGFGQAPYDLPFLLLFALIGAVWLYRARAGAWSAAWLGWAFGTGYFVHVLQWLVSPFMVQPEKHAWIAPFALLGLSLFMASYWALAFGVARRLSARAWPLIFALPLAEILRAYAFTGFAWGMPSQALVGVIGGQALAWIGPYAVSMAMVAVAVMVSTQRVSFGARLAQGAVLVAALAAVMLPVSLLPVAIEVADRPVIRLVQPNVPQRDKWKPDLIETHFIRQLDYTAAPAQPGLAAPELVVWSETAIPWSLDLAQSALDEIAAAATESGATVMLGVQRRGAGRFYNSLAVLERDGQVAQVYDKHHLVPYGEYMPFGDLLAKFGIYGLAAGEGYGYSKGAGPEMLDLGVLGSALPLICYEAVFPHDVNAAPTRPNFLIQITNDAWFGKAAGPKQHLAQARMRAIEQGLPLARAANTGISAMIDPKGRITASLALNEAGFVDAALPAPLPPTLYSRTKDWPLMILLLLGLGAAGMAHRRKRVQVNPDSV